tara:strand:- start:567 stop:1091 length:525 start_codon:yes stop_codon:yes gene_type:complete
MKIKLPKLPKLKLKKPFMMHLLGLLILSVGIQLGFHFGYIQMLYYSDVTKLSVVIAGIFAWQTFICGVLIHDITARGYKTDLDRKIERGWFYSDVVLSIGMVGTVIGFIIMLSGFSNIDFENVESVQGLISEMGYGMSTALSTTLVGLVSSILLKLQFFLLETQVEFEKTRSLP